MPCEKPFIVTSPAELLIILNIAPEDPFELPFASEARLSIAPVHAVADPDVIAISWTVSNKQILWLGPILICELPKNGRKRKMQINFFILE